MTEIDWELGAFYTVAVFFIAFMGPNKEESKHKRNRRISLGVAVIITIVFWTLYLFNEWG